MDNRIISVLDHIEDHLGMPMKLGDLARVAGMSSSQFHRLFKKETGSTPFRFIEQLKITKAYQTILHEEISVLDLAILLGYNDYETFSRAFKKYYHLAPDDLKSVVIEIRSHFSSRFEGVEEPEILFIPAEEETTEEELMGKIKEFLGEKGLTLDQLPWSVAYRVKRTTNQPGKAVSINRKLEIEPDEKLWMTLLQNLKN